MKRLKEFTIIDFKGQMSAITRKYAKKRKAILGQEKLILSSFKNNILTIKVFPTNGGKVRVIFDGGKRESTSSYYLVKIYFIDFEKWVPNPKELDEKEFRQILRVCDIKLNCTCAAFHYQGFRYKLSQLKSALFPTTIADPHWDKYHKGGLICKHQAVVLNRFLTNARQVMSFIKKFF